MAFCGLHEQYEFDQELVLHNPAAAKATGTTSSHLNVQSEAGALFAVGDGWDARGSGFSGEDAGGGSSCGGGDGADAAAGGDNISKWIASFMPVRQNLLRLIK